MNHFADELRERRGHLNCRPNLPEVHGTRSGGLKVRLVYNALVRSDNRGAALV